MFKKIFLLSFIIFTSNSFAGNNSSLFKSTSTLSSSCTVSVGNVNIADLNGTAKDVWTTGSIQTLCTRQTNISIQLSLGNNVDSYNYRQMTGSISGDKIKYTICQTKSANTVGWGGPSAGCTSPFRGSSYPLNTSGTGFLQNFNFYLLTQSGFYTPDNYSDTIVTTILF